MVWRIGTESFGLGALRTIQRLGLMRYFLPLLLSLLLLCGFASGQHLIRGRVLDSVGAPLPFAQVQLYRAEGRSPIAFTQSNPKGLFTLKVKEVGTYRLEVRSLGHAEHLQEVLLGNTPEVQLGSIQLRAHYEEIHAVQVLGERPVVRKGDSLIYRVEAFAKGNEKSIGEVMNKMPGLKVESDGSVSYQGKPVERMMVGGADLFGRGYGVLTNNLNPSAVKEVQVLENFEENRLLKRMRSKSERVAINLEMKDGAGQVVGTLDGSYGYRYMHRVNVSLVGVKRGQQWSLLANSNTVGETPVQSWANPQGLNDIGSGEDLKLQIPKPFRLEPVTSTQGSNAPLSAARRRHNLSHMLGFGTVLTPSRRFQLKANLVGQKENDKYASSYISQVQIANLSFTRDEQSQKESGNYTAAGRLTLDWAAHDKADLRYEGGYSFRQGRSKGWNDELGNRLSERSFNRWQRMDHTLLYTQSLDSAGLIRGGLEWQSQWLKADYSAWISGSTPRGLVDAQGLSASYPQTMHTGKTLWLYLAPIIRGFTGDARLGGFYFQQQLRPGGNFSLGGLSELRQLDLFAGGSVSYRREPLMVKVGLLGHTVRQELQTGIPTGIPRSRLNFLEPRVSFTLSDALHYALLQYSRNSTTSSLLDVLPETVVTSYRGTRQGATTFRLHHGNTYQAYYSYGNILSRAVLQAQLYYNHNSRPIVTSDVVTASRTTTYIIMGRRSSTLYAMLNADYFVGRLNTNFRFACSGQRSRYTQYVNGLQIPLTNDLLSAEISLRTNFRSVFDINIGADWRTNRLQSSTAQLRHSTSAYVDLEFTFGPVLWTTTVDRMEPGVLKGNPNAVYFLDSRVQLSLLKKKLTLYADGQNLLNTKTYTYYSVGNLEAAHLRYDIAPLRVMLGVKWQL